MQSIQLIFLLVVFFSRVEVSKFALRFSFLGFSLPARFLFFSSISTNPAVQTSSKENPRGMAAVHVSQPTEPAKDAMPLLSMFYSRAGVQTFLLSLQVHSNELITCRHSVFRASISLSETHLVLLLDRDHASIPLPSRIPSF